ncbi:metallophosphoesterase [Sphaerochaeta sp. PS]|uniref:metallophosphoesterase n=1 Tax=Sphaerochaeta sp. PS TaxID=3076336 RepID=UPI0028A3886F|nr:metallophosphoesterase [Sphaerochaeta sp. PS]MDT4761996.1 metallophosphoesterase [Sphaerochaeta sp. PS]
MKNLKRHQYILISIVGLIIIALLMVAITFFRLTHTKVYEQVSQYTEQFELPQASFDLPKAVEEHKAFTMEYPSDGKFTILWGTDFHLRRGPFSNRKKVYALLEKAFAETKPNLTVISGDLLFSLDAKAMLQEFALFMEEHQQYWAFGFGNHDGEYRYDRVALGTMLGSYPHALFSRGEEWVLGESDYTIALTQEGKPVQAIMILDSHDHRLYATGKGPDYIYPSQIAWYRWVAEGLEDVPLYTFLHIPLPEYRLMWDSGKATGVMLDRKVNTPWENTGLFQAMVETGTTVAAFSGHDHLNDFWGVWEGIELHTGRSASYGSYGTKNHAKGIKTLTLHKDDPTKLEVHTYTVDDWHL